MDTERVGQKDTVEIYNTKLGWRWRRKAPNGKIVGASSESYLNKPECEANAQRQLQPFTVKEV